MNTPTTYELYMLRACKLYSREGGTPSDFVWCNAHILSDEDLNVLCQEEELSNEPLHTFAECAEVLYAAHCED